MPGRIVSAALLHVGIDGSKFFATIFVTAHLILWNFACLCRFCW